MALISCPECGKEVSDKAESCPHCGVRIAPPPDDAAATVIPYKNAPALVAYYMGIFSLIPCVGLNRGSEAPPMTANSGD